MISLNHGAVYPNGTAFNMTLDADVIVRDHTTEMADPPAIDRVNEAVDFVLAKRLHQPQIAIILGSGLGGLSQDVRHATSIPYADIPHFQSTRAVGHAGQLLLGHLAGMPVAVMQGRYHRYEGHSSDCVSFPVRVLRALGATTLIVTNASGGLNPRYRPGDLMLVDQHIDCLWPRRACRAVDLPSDSNHAAGHVRHSSPIYDPDLIERVRRIAVNSEIFMQRGTYVATLGPTYETRAEYRMFRWMGGDAVGMSTVPEVLTARQLGMRALAISVITNVACTDSVQTVTHEEVVHCGRAVEPKLRQLVRQLLEEMSGPAD